MCKNFTGTRKNWRRSYYLCQKIYNVFSVTNLMMNGKWIMWWRWSFQSYLMAFSPVKCILNILIKIVYNNNNNFLLLLLLLSLFLLLFYCHYIIIFKNSKMKEKSSNICHICSPVLWYVCRDFLFRAHPFICFIAVCCRTEPIVLHYFGMQGIRQGGWGGGGVWYWRP